MWSETIVIAVIAAIPPTIVAVIGLIAILSGRKSITLQLGKMEMSINGKVDTVMKAVAEVKKTEGKLDAVLEMNKPTQTTVITDRRKE